MNKAVLIGRLTKDPEIKNTSSQIQFCNFTIAVDRRFKDQNGQKQTDFINCVAWRQTASFICSYFHKGNKIAIVGSIQSRSFDDNNGQRRYVTEVVADEAEFVESLQPTQAQQAATAPQIAPDINTATPGGAAVQAVKDIKEATSDSFDDIMSELPFSF